MKLRLDQIKDISILEASEDISVHEISILKAGIGKLLKSGKNKIILNLTNAKKLSTEMMEVILHFQSIAFELKGELILVGQGDLVHEVIQKKGKGNYLKFFTSKEAAVSSFDGDLKGTAATKDPALEMSLADVKKLVEKAQAENQKLKSSNSGKGSELKKVLSENALFKRKIRKLEKELEVIKKDHKTPANLDFIDAKIKTVETALFDLLKQDKLL
jgi:hypothetical protein